MIWGSESAGKLSLTNTELNTITANTIQIGDGNTTDVTVTSAIAVTPNLSITSAAITVNAGVNANAVTLTHTGKLDINAVGDFSLQGAFSEQGGGAVDLSGNITTNDDVTFHGNVTMTAGTLANPVKLDTGLGAGNVTFLGTLNDDAGGGSDQDLQITAGTGNVSFMEQVGDMTNLESLSIISANQAAFASSVGISFSLSIAANEIDFNGGADSVSTSGSGTLTLAPADPAQDIHVGGTADSGASVLDITDEDLAAIADGFAEITIGDESAGTGAVTVESSTFRDFITIVGGSISVTELDAGANDVSLVAGTGAITDGGDAGTDITGGQLKLDSHTGVAATGDELSTQVSTLAAQVQSGTGGIFVSNTGDLSIATVDGLTGLTTQGGDIVLTDDTMLTIDKAVDSNGGNANFTAKDGVTISATGTVETNDGNYTVDADSDTDNTGIYSQNGTVMAAAGAVSITAADVDLTADLSGTGTLAFTPSTASRNIGIGMGATGNFNLDDTDLSHLADGFSSITIGDPAGTGAVDINASTFTDPVTIVGGSIDVDGLDAGANDVTLTANIGAITTSPGQAVGQDITAGTATLNGTIAPGGSPGQLAVTGNLLLSSGDTYRAELQGDDPGTGYDQIVVSGDVTLTGVELDATRLTSFVPDVRPFPTSFTIISVGGTIYGEFAGHANGSIFAIDGISFQITYTDHVGVVLTVVAPTVVYVDDNFPNTNPGEDPDETPNDPGTPNVPGTPAVFGYDAFTTIQEGIDQVADGGTVIVYDGTYVEQLSIAKNLTLDGSGSGPGSRAILDAGNTSESLQTAVTLLDGISTLAIQNLRITNASIGIQDESLATIANLSLSNLIIDGPALGGLLDGITNLNVTLTANDDAANVSDTQFDSTGLQAISYSNVMKFNLNGDAGNDTFHVDPISHTNLTINGDANSTAPLSPGDSLIYNGPGLVNFTSADGGTIMQMGFNTVNFAGIETISTAFVSGTNNNFTVTAGADADDGDGDDFIVQQDGSGNLQVIVVDDLGNKVVVLSQVVGLVQSLTINGSTDDNKLTVDFINGDPLPSGGLFYNGKGDGISDNDVLVLQNGTVTSVDHSFTSAGKGSIAITPTDSPAGFITYTGLEPITDNLIATDRRFTFAATNDAITLGDDAAISRISSASTSETVDFKDPTGTLTIDAGGGDDTLTLLALDAAFNANVTVNGGLGRDTFDLEEATGTTNTYTFNGNAGADTFNIEPTPIDGPSISINGDTPAIIPGDTLNYDGAGNVVSTALGMGTITPATTQVIHFDGIETLNTANPPQLSIADESIAEGTDIPGNPTILTFTVTLSNGIVQPVTVDVSTAAGSAFAGSDFTSLHQTLTFDTTDANADGDNNILTQTVQVAINPDHIVEPDETFFVNLTNAQGAAIVDGTAIGTIQNDDAASFSIDDVTQVESGVFAFTVTLSDPVSAPTTVQVDTDITGSDPAIDALPDTDFTPIAGQILTFNPGDSLTQTVLVEVNNDGIVEGDETFLVKLSNASPNATISDDTGLGTILNDDVALISIGDAMQTEGDSGLTEFDFTVTLSEAISKAVTVRVDTAPLTADVTDYVTLINGLVTFDADSVAGATQIVKVYVDGDNIVENDEIFKVLLSDAQFGSASDPTRAAIDDETGLGTILNDDTAHFSISSVTQSESSGVFNFTVSLSKPVAANATVKVSTGTTGNNSAVDAMAGADFSAFSDLLLTFTPGGPLSQTVSVQVANDAIVERDETFTVGLSDAQFTGTPVTGGVDIDMAKATGLGTILNDDSATVSINDVTQNEGDGPFTFLVTLSRQVSEDVTVHVQSSPDTAQSGALLGPGVDFVAFNQNVTFAADSPAGSTQMVTINVNPDGIVEKDERFRVRLDSPQTPGGLPVTIQKIEGVGTILNDDQATVSVVGGTSVQESDGGIDFTVKLSKAVEAGDTISVKVDTIPGSAQGAGVDFAFPPQTLTFSQTDPNLDGDNDPLTQRVHVVINDDAIVENAETFSLFLSSPTFNGLPDPSRVIIDPSSQVHTVTITDDDTATVAINDVQAVEGGAFTFMVTLTGAIGENVTLLADTTKGTATSPDDFTAVSQMLTFAPEVPTPQEPMPTQTQSVTVQVNNDGLVEPPEDFLVQLSNLLFGGADSSQVTFVPGAAEGVGTIEDSAPPITVSLDQMPVMGNENGGPLTFTVKLSAPAPAEGVTVVVNTLMTNHGAGSGIDAIPNNDFTPLSDVVLTFAPGETTPTQALTVNLTPDNIVEPDETFLVQLSNPQVGGIVDQSRVILGSDATATGTILNDDMATISIANASMDEGNTGSSTMHFVVTLSAPVQGGLTLSYTTDGLTATDGTDFTALAPVHFTGNQVNETQMVNVSIIGDTLTEADETFQVVLGTPVPNQTGIAASNIAIPINTAIGTIVNDDSILVAAADAGGGPNVRVFDQLGNEIYNFFAYEGSFTGGVRVATGDVDGDGTPDIITAPGAGHSPLIKVFNGKTGLELGEFNAYPEGFTSGVFVTAADVNADGRADIITGPDAGGGPNVRGFSWNGSGFTSLFGFMAYDLGFTGGVRVATGDATGDGKLDIITGPGVGGGPDVRVFEISTILMNQADVAPKIHFMAFEPSFTGGVYVAAGQFGGDMGSNSFNPADIIVGRGAGATPQVRIFDPVDLSYEQLDAFPMFPGGVRVGTVERLGDSTPDLMVGAGPGGGPHIKIYNGEDIDVNRLPTNSPGNLVAGNQLFAFDPGFTGGVFVAGTVFPPTAGSPLRLAANAALPADAGPDLTEAQLMPLVSAAISRLEADGLAPKLAEALSQTQILVGNLAPGLLGLTSNGRITIDDNAAGVGWYIDATPQTDEEFQSTATLGLQALAPQALGRVDLFTVILHELGHVLGLPDLPTAQQPASLMSETLTPGLRRLPDRETLDKLFAEESLWESLL